MVSKSTRRASSAPATPVFFRYRKEILGGLALVVVIALIYAWAVSRQAAADMEAAKAIHQALRRVENLEGSPEQQAGYFAGIRRAHPGAHPVWEAYAFEYEITRNPLAKADEAIQLARQFLEKNARHPAAPRFAVGAAKLLAARGDFDEAERLCVDPDYAANETLPERLFLRAQIQERRAEKAESAGDAAAARMALERAEAVFQDVLNQAQERNWSPELRRAADFARVVIRDRLDGKRHSPPVVEPPVQPYGPLPPPGALPAADGAP